MKFSAIIDGLFDSILDEFAERVASRVIKHCEGAGLSSPFSSDRCPNPDAERSTPSNSPFEGEEKTNFPRPFLIRKNETLEPLEPVRVVAHAEVEEDEEELMCPMDEVERCTPSSSPFEGEENAEEQEDEENVTQLPPDPKLGKQEKVNFCMGKITSSLKKYGELNIKELAEHLEITPTCLAPSAPTNWAWGLRKSMAEGLVGRKKVGKSTVYFRL